MWRCYMSRCGIVGPTRIAHKTDRTRSGDPIFSRCVHTHAMEHSNRYCVAFGQQWSPKRLHATRACGGRFLGCDGVSAPAST